MQCSEPLDDGAKVGKDQVIGSKGLQATGRAFSCVPSVEVPFLDSGDSRDGLQRRVDLAAIALEGRYRSV